MIFWARFCLNLFDNLEIIIFLKDFNLPKLFREFVFITLKYCNVRISKISFFSSNGVKLNSTENNVTFLYSGIHNISS